MLVVASGAGVATKATANDFAPTWIGNNTGVSPGTELSVYDGDLTVTTPGAVIDGLEITGIVNIKAPDVTIRDSVIEGGQPRSQSVGLINAFAADSAGYRIEHVTLRPSSADPNFDGMKLGKSGSVEGVDISGTVDGIVIFGSDISVTHSYIHDLSHFEVDPNQGGSPSHDDDIQIQAGTGITIEDNTMTGAYNSAVMVTQDYGTTGQLAINRNWMDNGGCSVNIGSKGEYKTGLQMQSNIFGRGQRNAGCAIIYNPLASDLVPVSNIWLDGTNAGIWKGA